MEQYCGDKKWCLVVHLSHVAMSATLRPPLLPCTQSRTMPQIHVYKSFCICEPAVAALGPKGLCHPDQEAEDTFNEIFLYSVNLLLTQYQCVCWGPSQCKVGSTSAMNNVMNWGLILSYHYDNRTVCDLVLQQPDIINGAKSQNAVLGNSNTYL